jgi:flavin-dependent dehydrogenase
MAAIALIKAGYEVAVYDARPAHDLHSDGILGIQEDVWAMMLNERIPVQQYELNSGNRFRYITWTDLHHAITIRAMEMGAIFNFARKVNASEYSAMGETIVVATGVGSAKEVSAPEYTGYMIVRGLSSDFAGTSWASQSGNDWEFKIGDTRLGASITWFIPRDRSQVQFKTTYSVNAPLETSQLAPKWRKIAANVPLYQYAPMSDWDVPGHMVTFGAPNVVRIGDANGQLRPATSMGANQAIAEALAIPLLINRQDEWREGMENYLLTRRSLLAEYGKLLAIHGTVLAN